jgi:prefoldin subunit 5
VVGAMSKERMEEIGRRLRQIEHTTEYHEREIEMLKRQIDELYAEHDALSEEVRRLKVCA